MELFKGQPNRCKTWESSLLPVDTWWGNGPLGSPSWKSRGPGHCLCSLSRIHSHPYPNPHPHPHLGVFDTLSDSIQCSNFAKIWFNQYLIQYCFAQNSIQNIIQFKKNLLIQFKRWFNSLARESLLLVRREKCPKIAPEVPKIDKKGGFPLKMANIDSKYDSFIHFTVKFNSKDYSI